MPALLRQVSKGPQDVITTGARSLVCDLPGGWKRCGGLGDVLTGSLATFLGWALPRKRSGTEQSKGVGSPGPNEEQPAEAITVRRLGTRSSHSCMLSCALLPVLRTQTAAYAACALMRHAAAAGYAKQGRAMVAGDVLEQLPSSFITLFGP
jgi:ATP-dependent NAD(P)H-hydrate dehydratase